MATYCLICGLPIQHDHYVPTERENFFGIYRQDNKPEGHFIFGQEHDWLLKGVGVAESAEPLFGTCEDGVLGGTSEREGYFVCDGYEEACAFHTYCWEVASKPRSYKQVSHFQESPEMNSVKPYQGQLFEFTKCVDDGNGWMLQNPNGVEGQRSKERILGIVNSEPDPS